MSESLFRLPLLVKCPVCGKEKKLTSQRMGKEKFTAELCDGPGFGRRHFVTQMVGPLGRIDA